MADKKNVHIEYLCRQSLLNYLEHSGDSVTKMSKTLGIHPQGIYNWLKGEKTLSLRIWDMVNQYIHENQ